jgi:outer membrane receptor protein involved in Fe transport
MVNAGKSESYGLDLGLSTVFNIGDDVLNANASYGYTHATFTDYDGGENKGETFVYDGNYVPFAPQHTMSLATDYTMNFSHGVVRNLCVGANLTGRGRTYWTEKNDVSQPFYMLLGAHVTADFGKLKVNLWGKNLTQTDYVPFYFESMSKGFAQTCRPLQIGVDVAYRF